MDESYFGPRRVRGGRGRGAARKTPVFGMSKRGGKVYTQVVKNCSMAEILPIIEGRTSKQMAVYSDGIENFRGRCKVRLARFRGIHKQMFYYRLKECEFRFNMRHENMYKYLLKSIRNRPLKAS